VLREGYSFNNGYSIKGITDLRELERWRTLWDGLAGREEAYLTFLCFDWFRIWLKNFLEENQLFILFLYENDELKIIAPFLMKRERAKGIRIKKIELMGNVYSPFRYFLCDEIVREARQKDLFFIFKFLRDIYHDWDVIELEGIPEENDHLHVLRWAIKRSGLKHHEYPCYGDWYLDEITYDGDEYICNLPKRIVKDIQYCQRRLQKMGSYEFRVIRNEDDVEHYMDVYYDVYSKSWQEKEGIGPTFHRDLAKMAARKGWLRLGFLLLDGIPIASQFWISCNKHAFILKTVYDQAYKRYSPGKILTSELMKFVIDIDKVKALDYVQGDETYKRDWAPKRRERNGILIFNSSIRGRWLAFLNMRILPVANKNRYLRKVKEMIGKPLRWK
jgi:CelD/BcsL family acetyltransferase involved in cellulose biosynthesis